MRARHLVTLAATLVLSPLPASAVPAEEIGLVEAGRRIYEEGVLTSGAPLRGWRAPAGEVLGARAACVQCHRRSGMGAVEGTAFVPPVAGPALFRNERPGGAKVRRAPGMRFRDHPSRTRPAYDDASLARAIRDGVSPAGLVFSDLMPRYALAEEDMRALVAYLRRLSAQPSPGAGAREMHFATVVTPGQDASRRRVVLDVLQACFAERFPADGRSGQIWRLHVWALAGDEADWGRQLDEHYAAQPVFGLVSGLGRDRWAPVHDFCEARRVPCLFANVDMPGRLEAGTYNFYFTRGLALEAEVAARYLRQRGGTTPLRRLLLVRARGDEGARVAAEVLSGALADSGIAIREEVLSGSGASEARRIFEATGPDEAVMLWLPEGELAALVGVMPAPPAAGVLLVSGTRAGLERAPLGEAWRSVAEMIYPLDPPGRREVRMRFNLRPWLAGRGIAAADEVLAGNTLAACNLLAESVLRLRGAWLRDYLVEWIENYPSGMGNAPAPQAFPRFSLGPGQRFSSKGAYIVRFAGPTGARLEPVTDWIRP
jgi:mono/diheme cytochrome c family protein